MLLFGFWTTTPRGTLLEAKSGCDTVALLNISVLGFGNDAGNGAVGARLEDLRPTDVFGAAIDFDRVAAADTGVEADSDFDRLGAGATADAADKAFDLGCDVVGAAGGVEAGIEHD